MITRIHKWWNSLVILSHKLHNMIIAPVREGEDLSLSVLLSDINEDNLQIPVELGEPAGRELM